MSNWVFFSRKIESCVASVLKVRSFAEKLFENQI